MKKSIFFLCIFLFSILIITKAQKSSNSKRKKYKYYWQYALDSLKIEKPDFQINDEQIRIIIHNYATGLHKIFIINKAKKNGWNGKSYEYYDYNDTHYDFSNILIQEIPLTAKWDSAVNYICTKNYITLPSQTKVEKEIKQKDLLNPQQAILVIADGTSYSFEFLTKKKKYKFFTIEPDTYLKFYQEQKKDISYFLKYLDLIKTLESALDFNIHLKKPTPQSSVLHN